MWGICIHGTDDIEVKWVEEVSCDTFPTGPIGPLIGKNEHWAGALVKGRGHMAFHELIIYWPMTLAGIRDSAFNMREITRISEMPCTQAYSRTNLQKSLVRGGT